MRLHALTLAILVLGAHSATLPDKKDIEKKLTDAVKEVLEKDDTAINTSSEQELIDQANAVKDVENNLRKSVQVADIPVKVVVDDPQQLKVSEVKENNEVADSDESAEIKRVEVDLKNPGPPQIMQHDNQNPEHFDTAEQVQEHHTQTQNSMWRSSTQYAAIQQNIQNIKSSLSQLAEYWSKSAQQPAEEGIQVRTSEKAESSGCSSAPSSSSSSNNNTFGLPPFGSGPFATGWSNWVSGIQNNIQQLNETFNSYIANNTSGNNFGTNIFNFGNASSAIASQANTTASNLNQSADDPKPQQNPWWQGITNIFNPQQSQAPPSAQSDTPQPNRPVINAITSVIGNFVPRPQAPPAPAVEPAQPAKPVTEEGSNAVPAKNPEPEQQKDKPQEAQPVTQSGPIKQFIGRNPIVQGLAGAVQRIQHTIVPPKPRDEVKDAEKDGQATKGGFRPRPPGNGPTPGDNNDVSSSGVAVKSELEAEKQEVPVQEPIKEETAPVVPEKTE